MSPAQIYSPVAQRGWLTQRVKRERRDSYEPLKEEEVRKLIAHILTSPVHTKLTGEVGKFYRLRNAAIISILWLFGKRINEVLRLETDDVWIDRDSDELRVKFLIQKKAKRYKGCEFCKTRNARDARFCKGCGRELRHVVMLKKGSPAIRTKSKKLGVEENALYLSCILNYMEYRKRFPAGYFFVPLSTRGKACAGELAGEVEPMVRKRICRSTVYLMLDKYTLSPHIFRYAFAKRMLRKSKGDVVFAKEAGDWARVDTLMGYAKSIGITPEDEKFAEL